MLLLGLFAARGASQTVTVTDTVTTTSTDDQTITVTTTTSTNNTAAAAATTTTTNTSPSGGCAYQLVSDGAFTANISMTSSASPWSLSKSNTAMQCDVVTSADGTTTYFYAYNPLSNQFGACTFQEPVSLATAANVTFLSHFYTTGQSTYLTCMLASPSLGREIVVADARNLVGNSTIDGTTQVSASGTMNLACTVRLWSGSSFSVYDVSLIADRGGPCPATVTAASAVPPPHTVLPVPAPTAVSSSNNTTPSIGGFNYVGCVTELTTRRALLGASVASSGMTLDACAKFCNQWQYFGAEYGRECFCGQYLARGSRAANETDCNQPCAGNKTQTCGAAMRISLYQNQVGPGPSNPTSVVSNNTMGNSGYMGCFSEVGGAGGSYRTLSQASLANDHMTLELCEDFCINSGIKLQPKAPAPFTYWGTEYGRECYCDNSLRLGSQEYPDEDCQNMACAGNINEFCGGPMRLSLYQYLGNASTTTSAKTGSGT